MWKSLRNYNELRATPFDGAIFASKWRIFVCIFNNIKAILDIYAPKYQQARCHMIFDINMGNNFHRKACMVEVSDTK